MDNIERSDSTANTPVYYSKPTKFVNAPNATPPRHRDPHEVYYEPYEKSGGGYYEEDTSGELTQVVST